jgi:type II secretory pathway component GspD/PulD (secretin)
VRRHDVQMFGMIAVCVLVFGTAGASQEKTKTAQQPVAAAAEAGTAPLLRVQITFARYQGEKKISSAPYTLLMNADGSRGGVRIGAQVPVPVAPSGASADRPSQVVQYRDIGTSIDCSARSTANGLYQLELSIEDTSVVADESQAGTTKNAAPSFRVFRASHKFAAREGQLTQFTGATDRASGDVVRVELTLNRVN